MPTAYDEPHRTDAERRGELRAEPAVATCLPELMEARVGVTYKRGEIVRNRSVRFPDVSCE